MNRKRAALSQDDLAGLLAISQSAVSRLDARGEATSLETALGLQVIFDIQPRIFFAALYGRIEEAVMTQAAKLDGRIRGRTDAAARRKQRLLAAMVKRVRVVSHSL